MPQPSQHHCTVCDGDVLIQGKNGRLRVVIPLFLQHKVLSLLHRGHWEIVLTKCLTHQNVYWKGINTDIASLVAACPCYQSKQAALARLYFPWPEASTSWVRLRLDFAGPFLDSSWFLQLTPSLGFLTSPRCQPHHRPMSSRHSCASSPLNGYQRQF